MHQKPSPADDATTLRVRTLSGGMHVWYRSRPGHRMLSSTGAGKSRALAWQVDVRGVGGYIVTPGTVTPNGTYTVEPGTTMPRMLPAWLSAELDRTGHCEPP
ncbi:bifunctional DNA primase/polymerase [Yinghuangia aomiensis]